MNKELRKLSSNEEKRLNEIWEASEECRKLREKNKILRRKIEQRTALNPNRMLEVE